MKKTAILLTFALIISLLYGCAKNDTVTDSNGTSQNVNTEADMPASEGELICDSIESFDYADVEDGVIITLFNNFDNIEYDKVIIPETIDGKDVVGIGAKEDNGAYYGMVFSALVGNCEVVIPKTVQYIGGKAFFYSLGLKKVSGGENCQYIGELAFGSCENLTEVTFIDNVTEVDDSAFIGCTKLGK